MAYRGCRTDTRYGECRVGHGVGVIALNGMLAVTAAVKFGN